MKVIVIGGFLGSGKTTLLLQLAKYLTGKTAAADTAAGSGSPARVAIIENEIGETGIDDKIIAGEGYSVRGIFSGCVCCSLAGALTESLQAIEADLHPAYVIIETTGAAFPSSVKKVLSECFADLSVKICCVADAKRWKRLLPALKHVIGPQLDGADLILVNKTDLVDADTLADVEASVSSFNGTAARIAVSAKSPVESGVWERLL